MPESSWCLLLLPESSWCARLSRFFWATRSTSWPTSLHPDSPGKKEILNRSICFFSSGNCQTATYWPLFVERWDNFKIFRKQNCHLDLFKGLWSFWKPQLSALFLASETEASRLLPESVEEGAEWEQSWEERSHPLKPDPWCSKGKCTKLLRKRELIWWYELTKQKPGPYCEEEHDDGGGGDAATAGKDGKISSVVGGTAKPHSLRSERDCQMILNGKQLAYCYPPTCVIYQCKVFAKVKYAADLNACTKYMKYIFHKKISRPRPCLKPTYSPKNGCPFWLNTPD